MLISRQLPRILGFAPAVSGIEEETVMRKSGPEAPSTGTPSVESASRRTLLLSGGWLAGITAILGIQARATTAEASMQSEPLVGSWKQQIQREGLPPALSL